MYKTLAIALAAAANALPAPAPQSGSSVGASPPTGQQFALGMLIDGGSNLVSLNAVTNGTIGNLVLKAERPAAYPGTPAYFNTTGSDGTYKALNFVLSDGIYGAQTSDAGHAYGNIADVTAIFGYQQFEWTSYNGTLGHKLASPLNGFYACFDEAEGEENLFLKWGNADYNGDIPEGCETTTVVLNCNVEGGATDCSCI